MNYFLPQQQLTFVIGDFLIFTAFTFTFTQSQAAADTADAV